MKILREKKIIFWDFDGVILDSMAIRNKGFEIVLQDYPRNDIQELLDYHLKNGGLSRYNKFRYFFEKIKGQNITEVELSDWAFKFSRIMRQELVNPKLLIDDSLCFIKKNRNIYNMHVVSGSDQEELRYLCGMLGLSKYFISIHGSPSPKKRLVRDLILENSYLKKDIVLIGDSINDYDAAVENEIAFVGYNNIELKGLTPDYISNFKNL